MNGPSPCLFSCGNGHTDAFPASCTPHIALPALSTPSACANGQWTLCLLLLLHWEAPAISTPHLHLQLDTVSAYTKEPLACLPAHICTSIFLDCLH
mmetsp:Transcript_24841/g.42843  ORF Transcript_24841/g.42843 Transcript_24841/m.42843 type:complete len:96 (+) Transcript_24841:656-943(+)